MIKEGRIEIQVFYIQDCPGYRPTLDAIRRIVEEERVTVAISSVEVDDPNTAGFQGSPTVRVNGRDIEDMESLRICGVACRTYRSSGALSNFPSDDLIRSAIRRACI